MWFASSARVGAFMPESTKWRAKYASVNRGDSLSSNLQSSPVQKAFISRLRLGSEEEGNAVQQLGFQDSSYQAQKSQDEGWPLASFQRLVVAKQNPNSCINPKEIFRVKLYIQRSKTTSKKSPQEYAIRVKSDSDAMGRKYSVGYDKLAVEHQHKQQVLLLQCHIFPPGKLLIFIYLKR